MERRWFVIGCVLAAVAVAAGAFGAHGLRPVLTEDMLSNWETAARYQTYHALALVGLGIAGERLGARWAAAAGWLFVAGVALFSGSLYVMALTGIRALGAVTPFGGVAFIAGWVCLIAGARRP